MTLSPLSTSIRIRDPSTVTVPANIVRVQRCGNGWYEVGALFLKKNEDQPPAT